MTSGSVTYPGYTHGCLAYDDPAVLRTLAVEQVTAGLAAGEQVWVICPEDRATVTGWLASVPGVDAARRRDALRLVPSARRTGTTRSSTPTGRSGRTCGPPPRR